MIDWFPVLHRRLNSESTLVRVTVARVRGSAPREQGACMLVGETTEEGTIGGGHLELKAIETARQMLKSSDAPLRLDRFALGATLGQCCGGVVELWFERFTTGDRDFLRDAMRIREDGKPVVVATRPNGVGRPERQIFTDSSDTEAHRAQTYRLLMPNASRATLIRSPEAQPDFLIERIDQPDTPLWLFGAGHIGKALVKIMADLPFRITWIDSREAMFPTTIPDNVTPLFSDSPADEVEAAPPGTYFLVLTHSHDIDYEICRAILQRDDFIWAGLIGSASKISRFMQRLSHQGVPLERIARLTCPIGAEGITDKRPAAIAVSVAAQLLQLTECAAASGVTTQAKKSL
ncbi:MAG TPA: xanthine dehydrogenase accessory protein XdhC [Burkholderiales bacterium]|nr:xanthine dehydrogenase accessory protein XdhC [Burkholderiales bacterium]